MWKHWVGQDGVGWGPAVGWAVGWGQPRNPQFLVPHGIAALAHVRASWAARCRATRARVPLELTAGREGWAGADPGRPGDVCAGGSEELPQGSQGQRPQLRTGPRTGRRVAGLG